MKYEDLSKEQKVCLVYQYLLEYINDYLACTKLFSSYRTNQLLEVILKLLDDISVYNKTIRHIDWKNPRRYIGTMVRILRKMAKKYPNYRELSKKHKELIDVTIKDLVLS